MNSWRVWCQKRNAGIRSVASGAMRPKQSNWWKPGNTSNYKYTCKSSYLGSIGFIFEGQNVHFVSPIRSINNIFVPKICLHPLIWVNVFAHRDSLCHPHNAAYMMFHITIQADGGPITLQMMAPFVKTIMFAIPCMLLAQMNARITWPHVKCIVLWWSSE